MQQEQLESLQTLSCDNVASFSSLNKNVKTERSKRRGENKNVKR